MALMILSQTDRYPYMSIWVWISCKSVNRSERAEDFANQIRDTVAGASTRMTWKRDPKFGSADLGHCAQSIIRAHAS